MWWSKWKVPIIISAVVIVIMVIAWKFMGKDYATEIVDNMVKKQQAQIMTDYKERLKKSEERISAAEGKIKSYDKKILTLKNKVGGLENDIANNKKPEDSIELRNRFCKYGIVPVGYECPR
jgi:peptidoglycan hydrolase CwlO-like protein